MFFLHFLVRINLKTTGATWSWNMVMETEKSQYAENAEAKVQEASRAAIAHIDQLLDEALEETFPASDPVAIHIEHEGHKPQLPNTHLVADKPF